MSLINIMIFATVAFFTTRPALAYLDPGSGSFLFQMAIGALLGGLLTIKIYFRRFKEFLAGKVSKPGPKKSEGKKDEFRKPVD